jgi:hypothetical protein
MAKGKGGGINIVLSADADALKKGLAEARAALSKTADMAEADQKRLSTAAGKFTSQAANAGSLRQQARALTNLAASYEDMGAAGSKAYRDTLKQAGALRDRMGDLSMAIDAGHAEGKVKVFGQAMQASIGIIAGAEGAMQLFGMKADDAAKVTAKLQSLMAMSQGIGGILALKDAVTALAANITLAGTATAALNAIMSITPLGWLGIGFAAIVAAFGKFTTEAKKVTEAQKTMNSINTETTRVLKEEYAQHLALIGIVKSEVTSKAQKEAALRKLKELYPGYLDQLDIEKTSTKDLNAAMTTLNATIYKRAQAQAAMTELTKIAGEEMNLMAELEKKRDGRLKKSQEMTALGMSPGQQEKALATYDLEIKAIDNSIAKINERKQTALKFLSQNPETAIVANNVSAAEAEQKRKDELAKAEQKRLSDLEKARSKAAEEEKAMLAALADARDLSKGGKEHFESTASFWQMYGARSEESFKEAMENDRQYWDLMTSQGVHNYKQYIEHFRKEFKDAKEFGDMIAPPAAAEVVKANFGKIVTEMDTLAQKLPIGIRIGGQQMVGEINGMVSSATDAIGQLAEDLASKSEYAYKDFGNNLLLAVAGFMQTLGKAIIAAGIASKTFQEALLVNPVLAVGAGVALVAAAGAVKGIMKRGVAQRQTSSNTQSASGDSPGIRMFAEGGIISGPTVGMMGEYPGAKSNPEVVAPLNKLKDMIGGDIGGGQLMARISGQDLLIMLDRAETYRGRVR